MAERVSLYQRVPPLGETVLVSEEVFMVDDSIMDEEDRKSDPFQTLWGTLGGMRRAPQEVYGRV